LIDSKNSTLPVRINLVIDSYVGYIKTKNVIAETIHGDHDNVVSLGAHSDSVAAGPGINDDGSGTISLLTVAKQLTNFKVNNAVRFAWWAAEEEGLLGSNFYANSLTPEENSKLRLFMDYDMMASPNYEYQVYNGSNAVNPKGSEEIKDLYIDYYESKGLNWTLIPFDGRSDYVGFIENGIPGGGVAAGAEGKNSENGEVLDKCYHLLCDDLTNIAWDAFLVNTQLIAHSVATYGRSLEGFPLREMGVKSFNNDFAYRGDFLLY
jgi:aminopeptidase Y